jgi:hypothetical protein
LEKKRRKVDSQKGKLLAEISRACVEQLQILKRMAKKTEAVNSHNPIYTFFRSMAQTVMQFPPNIIAETRVKVRQLVGEMEAKALYEQNRPTASGCPYHSFSSSFHYQVLCYSGHGHVPPVSCQSSTEMCRLQAQQLIHVVMCHLQNQHQCQHHLKMEMKGEALRVMNLTPTPPALLKCSSLAENCYLI